MGCLVRQNWVAGWLAAATLAWSSGVVDGREPRTLGGSWSQQLQAATEREGEPDFLQPRRYFAALGPPEFAVHPDSPDDAARPAGFHGHRPATEPDFQLAQFRAAARRARSGDIEELETDRDAFTPATSNVSPGLIVVESSYSFIDNRNVAETHSFPELLTRIGITHTFELRLGWNYEVGGAGDDVSGNDGEADVSGLGVHRESQMLYGAKVDVTVQSGWVPRSVVIVEAFTPTSGVSTATDVVYSYVWGWELPRGWRWDTAMRYAQQHERQDAFNQWAPSTVLRIPLSERWKAHIEYFGIYTQNAARDASVAFISPGTHYLLTPNLELGLRLGWGISQDAPPFFSNVGFAYRF